MTKNERRAHLAARLAKIEGFITSQRERMEMFPPDIHAYAVDELDEMQAEARAQYRRDLEELEERK